VAQGVGPLITTTATGLLRGTRPAQWSKNLLVFAAPVAAGLINQPQVAVDAGLAFVAFCAASAGSYLLNDARDVDADRNHPTKRLRPVASGQISVAGAHVAGTVLLVGALVLGTAVAPALGWTIAGYLLLTTMYSFGLKSVPVVDLVTVAAGFVLRAVAGAAATGVPLSQWFVLVTSAGALLMVTAKREAELARHHRSDADPNERSTRAVLESYTPGFLTSVRTIAAGLLLIAYCLWAFEGPGGDGVAGVVSDAVVGTGTVVWLQLSVVPFAVAVLRYVLLADAGAAERPERLMFTDPVLVASGALWAIIYGYGTYFA
jgi:decaprenyl-phosphate phosphoribosyltransferase